MTQANTDFGRVADDLRRAAGSFALLTSQASLFGQAIQSFREFEKQLVLTNAIAGGTVSTLEAMKTAAREFSLVTTTSAVEAGAALQQLAQAGFSAQESLSAMTGVLLLAQATLSDVRVTSDIVSSNIRAFGLATTDATRVANVFSAAITGSLATMDKLAFAMRQVAPVAELAGLSIEDTTAALGVLFNIGLRGEQAGTALRNIIIRLVRPLGEAGDLLREAGIATRDATGEFRQLADILTDIGNSDLSDADLARIFETEALAGAKAFIKALQTVNNEGVNQYDQLRNAITDTDRAVELAAANLSTFDGAMGLFNNTINDVAKDLGAAVAPVIISITDGIRTMVASFRELDPGTQEMIAQFTVFGTAAVGLLASVNALALLFRGPLVASLAAATTGFFSAAAGATGFSLSMSGILFGINRMVQTIGAATLTMVGYTSSVAPATAATITFSGVLNTVTARLAAMRAALIANAGAIALTVTGLGVIAAAGAAAVLTIDSMTTSAWELDEAMSSIDSREFLQGQADARAQADSIIGAGVVEEVTNRVSQIEDQMRILSTASYADQFGFAGRAQDRIATEVNHTAELLRRMEAENADILQVIKLGIATDAAIAEYESEVGQIAGIFDLDVPQGRMRDHYLDAFNDLTDEQKGRVVQLQQLYADLLKANNETFDQIAEFQFREEAAIRGFLTNLQRGEANVGEYFELAAKLIAERGLLNDEEFANALTKELAAREGAVSIEDVLRAVLEQRSGLSADEIENLLTLEEQHRQDTLLAAITGLNADLAKDVEEVRLAMLEQELERTTQLTEAIRLARELGMGTLEKDLTELSEDLTKQFGEVLVDFGVDLREGIDEVFANAIEEAGISINGDSIPGFSDVIDGTALIDAINDQIDGSTTEDEAAAIIEREKAKYTAIMMAYVAALVEAGTVTEAQAEEIKRAAEAATTLITGKFLEGLGDTQDSITEHSERIQREADKAARAAASAARKQEAAARKALRLAQRMRGEFRAVADAMADAQRGYLEAIRGLGVDTRAQLAFDLDVQSIAREAENQIATLNEKFEQLALGYEGDEAALANLRSQYDQLIKVIELERDANIAAASSFEAQMQRRSAAIDLFIRDMQDVAFASQDTFTKVGAGIASAFAEYNKDLVTLVDITKNATTDFIDTMATAVGDFVFDQENLWENFKKSMLNISRQIVEGFTKAFIQQAISNLTGGAGSIFGNALQPSPYGNEGVPSVGVGGILGKIFPGLAGGGNAPNAAGGAAGLEGVMQSVTAQTQQVYQTHLTQQQTIFQQFTTGLQAAMNSVVASVNGMAGGGGIGTVATGAVTEAASAGITGLNTAMTTVTNQFAKSGNALVDGIVETANALGVSARDLATVISYETGGTFDPLQRGPTTQWGQHRGLIQFGEPQAQQFGVDFSSYAKALETQLGPNGGIVQYLKASGFEEGMSILDLYSTINAGAPGRYYASDANNGGAPGNVLDKVNNQFGGHYANADELLAGLDTAVPAIEEAATGISGAMTDAATEMARLPSDLRGIVAEPAVLGAQPAPLAAPAALDPARQAGQGILPAGLGALGGEGGMTAMGTQFQTMFTTFMTQIQTTLTTFTTQFQTALQQAVASVQQAAASAGGGGGALAGLIPKFSTGGDVLGAGTATSDSILAFLSNGEHVTSAKQAALYRPLLHAINKGASQDEVVAALLRSIDGPKLPAFAYGGDVGRDFSYGAVGGGRVQSNSGDTYNIDKSKGGDNVTLRVNYVMNGAQQGKDKFRRSGAQHAKQLARQMERARKNS